MATTGRRKGTSGRKKGTLNKNTLEIKDLIDKYAKPSILISKLSELALKDKGDALAIKVLLEYRYGKPRQGVDLAGDIVLEVIHREFTPKSETNGSRDPKAIAIGTDDGKPE